MDAGDGPRGERPVVPAAGPQQVRVEVVDVRSGQLGQVEVAEMRLEMALDDGAGMAHGGSEPARRRGLDPLVEQVSERAGPDPSAARLGDQLLELPASEPAGAMDGLAEPSRPPRRRIGAEVDTELPGVATTKAHRARSHDRRLYAGVHGQAMANS